MNVMGITLNIEIEQIMIYSYHYGITFETYLFRGFHTTL